MSASKCTVKWNGDKIQAEVAGQARAGVNKALEVLLTKSNETVPHDEGTLQLSGEVVMESETKGRVRYGGEDVGYAIRLHEHPEYHFQNGRRGKWLESTIREQARNLLNILKGFVSQAHK